MNKAMNEVFAKDLINWISEGVFPTVQFTRGVEDYDGYFDQNMKARAVSYDLPDKNGVVKITFYVQGFDEHNHMVEKRTYWPTGESAGNGLIKTGAREAGMHPSDVNGGKEDFYADMEIPLPLIVLSIND